MRYRFRYALAAMLAPMVCLAGPPFQTDDPEPVDFGHYEFYVFSNVASLPARPIPSGPAFEFNWGALPNTQLHAVLELWCHSAPWGIWRLRSVGH